MDAVRPVRKPAGGFRFVPVSQWCQLWSAYRRQQLRLGDVRVWCALQECLARRCLVSVGQPRRITAAELRALVGPRVPIRPALTRLAAVALVEEQDGQLTIPDGGSVDHLPPEVQKMLHQIPNAQRRMPVPRRFLRFLARCGRRTHIATLLGHLLRCLYYRQGACRPVGFCAAAWIAAVFEVSLRSVKAARQALERQGVLLRLPVPHWARTRYGEKIAINLQWEERSHGHAAEEDHSVAVAPDAPLSLLAPVAIDTTGAPAHASARPPVTPSAPCIALRSCHGDHHATPPLAPPSHPTRQDAAPPDSYRKLSARRDTQQPAAGRPDGRLSTMVRDAQVALRSGTALPVQASAASPSPRRLTLPFPSPSLPHRQSTAVRPLMAPAQSAVSASRTSRQCRTSRARQPFPTLRHIIPQDLRDTRRVLELYQQAVQTGLLARSDASRLTFVALAQHVLTRHPDNPGGLFWRLLVTRRFAVITQAEEDAAQQQLKRFLYGEVRDDWQRRAAGVLARPVGSNGPGHGRSHTP